MSVNFLLLYITTIFIASVIPGPSMLLALTHGIKFGAKRTIASAMGNVTVTIVQAIISIVGLGTVLIASGMAFEAIKFAGAAYLIYLGIRVLFSPNMSFSRSRKNEIQRKISLRSMFSQAALVTAVNPKAIIFFTAIFPQFIDPSTSYVQQSCLLIGIASIIAFSCFMLYAICGQKIVFLFSEKSFAKHINKVIGGTFISAGIGLAVSNK